MMTRKAKMMTVTETLKAHAIILVAILPIALVFNESESILPNLAGLLYGVLLFRFGKSLAPKCVRKFIEATERDADENDTMIE